MCQRRKWPRGGLAASGVGGAGGASAASPTPAGAGRGGRSWAPRSPRSRRRRKRAEGHGGRRAGGARARPRLGRPAGLTPPPRSEPAAGPGRGAERARDFCIRGGAGPGKKRFAFAGRPAGGRAGTDLAVSLRAPPVLCGRASIREPARLPRPLRLSARLKTGCGLSPGAGPAPASAGRGGGLWRAPAAAGAAEDGCETRAHPRRPGAGRCPQADLRKSSLSQYLNFLNELVYVFRLCAVGNSAAFAWTKFVFTLETLWKRLEVE